MGRQAEALVRFAKGAKSMKALDPGVKPLLGVARVYEVDAKWKLVLNRPVEFD